MAFVSIKSLLLTQGSCHYIYKCRTLYVFVGFKNWGSRQLESGLFSMAPFILTETDIHTFKYPFECILKT